MNNPSKVIKNQLEKGKPLSSFAVDKLRKANQEEALRANAHNIVLAMLEGKTISQLEFDEAEHYFPKESQEWKDAGGTVKDEKKLAEWTSIYQIARWLGASEQAIHQMIKRNSAVAPRPNHQGKYNKNEVKEFYENHSYSISKSSKDFKQKILEQEFRLKKCKADEAEGLVIAKATVIDILNDADITLEGVLKGMIKDLTKNEREQERAIKKAKIHFKRWREFIASLA